MRVGNWIGLGVGLGIVGGVGALVARTLQSEARERDFQSSERQAGTAAIGYEADEIVSRTFGILDTRSPKDLIGADEYKVPHVVRRGNGAARGPYP